tara:strand:+ start:412 stop:738 length:327 start_codon:yes stop_codon:yes gene_type:complete
MKRTIGQLEEDILKLTKELEQKRSDLVKYNKISESKKLAIRLHELLCTHNHTDGCNWEYKDPFDSNTWEAKFSPHYRYHQKAKALIQIMIDNELDIDTVMEIIKTVSI